MIGAKYYQSDNSGLQNAGSSGKDANFNVASNEFPLYKNQSDYKEQFPNLKSHLKLSGMIWVSWPKGGGLGTDLTLPKVINIGYGFGLVESTCLSINSTWSALKFTHPKAGKVYNNSHAELQSRTTNR